VSGAFQWNNRGQISVSACLPCIGTAYDGRSRPVPALIQLAARGRVVPICHEAAGGLHIPRPPAEIRGGDRYNVLDGTAIVVDIEGQDMTSAFLAGARCVLQRAHSLLGGFSRPSVSHPIAVLRAHSRSCSSDQIADGSFFGRLIEGVGVTTALLQRHGVSVLSETGVADVGLRLDVAGV
jgi:uncharacterized protein YbbK (DUF523 family)